jgi:hypothetical protein
MAPKDNGPRQWLENYAMQLAFSTLRLTRWTWLCLLILLAPLCQTSGAQASQSAPPLEPGLYQSADGLSAARLHPADHAWELVFWQGPAQAGPGAGFGYFGRFLPRAGTARLAGAWQSLPGSCCPGRGRGEIEALDSRSFRFAAFSPSLDQPPWPVLAEMVFSKVAELPAAPALTRLAGDWRVSMWYTDLLPGGAPADLVSGRVRLSADQGQAQGVWLDRPGQMTLSLQPSGLELAYQDQAAGYELSAALSQQANGLTLSGPFSSTLGRGKMRLVRAGLPADPGGPSAGNGHGLAGLWADPRTGNDFFQIKDTPQGFSFTAYGGAMAQPRYLSKGSARGAGPGRYEGKGSDQEGYCCGNQARFVFRLLSPEELEVSSIWWPMGQPDPGTPPSGPYILKRVQGNDETPAPARKDGRWPLIHAAKPGLLDQTSGAIKAAFTWRPAETGGQPAIYTLFSQGGYQRDMDLYIDGQGRLSADIATKDGLVSPKAETPLNAGEPHEAWLIYSAGGQARLVLDGAQAASAPMAQPWTGSNSPYLVGASRWPGRAFQGSIQRVELYATAQDPALDPAQPGQPALVITPPPATGQGGAEAPAESKSEATPLIRLWNPVRLVHAYVEKPQDLKRLQSQGWQRQGPMAGLWSQSVAGSEPLYGFRHRGKGYTLLTASQAPPPGCDALGLMGHILPQPVAGSVALYELKADLPEPLRGGSVTDLFYTTRPDSVEAARKAGYGPEQIVGYVQPVNEPAFSQPLLYTWGGAWRGEGWGRFSIKRQGGDLLMFWYYGPPDGPHYYGHYRLNPGLKRAEGIAVGRPGKSASYYRHVLEFLTGKEQGPKIRLTSWRLAAPLDDGRLVSFIRPKPTVTILQKHAQALPSGEDEQLAKALGPPDPAAMLHDALNAARNEGRLLER